MAPQFVMRMRKRSSPGKEKRRQCVLLHVEVVREIYERTYELDTHTHDNDPLVKASHPHVNETRQI